MHHEDFPVRLDCHFGSWAHSGPGYSGHGRTWDVTTLTSLEPTQHKDTRSKLDPPSVQNRESPFHPKFLLKPRINKSCSSISNSSCVFLVPLTAVTNETGGKTASSVRRDFFHFCTAAKILSEPVKRLKS